MVTAMPIDCVELPVVLELLKNTTETMLISYDNGVEGELFQNFVSRMNNMIAKDPLTGLYNRRYTAERLPADIVEADISGQPLTVCFLDLDDFKFINDQYGHESGDAALQEVSRRMMSHIRSEQDWVARYGGDEFVLCLKNTGKSKAREVVERIIQAVEQPIELSCASVTLRVSYGIESTEDAPMTAEKLISIADSRMFQAKSAKRAARQP